MPSDCRSNSMTETNAAAPPPTPLKIATICGIAVIFTSRAAGTAIAAPITIAMTREPGSFGPKWWRPGLVNVMPIARPAAAAPMRFPSGRRSASSGP